MPDPSPITAIAEAFSSHRFSEAYPHLSPDVRWHLVGGPDLTGPDAVVEACEHTSAELSDVSIDVRRFRSITGTDAVAVDTLTSYVEPDGQTSVVASCDLYDFVGDTINEITSYTVEVPTG